MNITLKNNIIRCKKLATNVSDQKRKKKSKYDFSSGEHKQARVQFVALTFRDSCLPIFTWLRVVLRFFNPNKLLRVSWILWRYYSKWYSVILGFTCLKNLTISYKQIKPRRIFKISYKVLTYSCTNILLKRSIFIEGKNLFKCWFSEKQQNKRNLNLRTSGFKARNLLNLGFACFKNGRSSTDR